MLAAEDRTLCTLRVYWLPKAVAKVDQKGLKSKRLPSFHQHEPDGNKAEHNHKLLNSILVQFRYGMQKCKGMALITKKASTNS